MRVPHRPPARHVLAAVLVLALVLAGTAAVTLAGEPAYAASATLEPKSEGDVVVSILSSRSYAASVADALEPQGTFLAAGTLHDAVDVTREGREVTVTATLPSPTAAAEAANAYVSTLSTWRATLEDVTWGRNWERVHEAADGDTADATGTMQALVDGTVYYERTSWAEPPGEPVSPEVAGNPAVGAVAGVGLASLALMGWRWRRLARDGAGS